MCPLCLPGQAPSPLWTPISCLHHLGGGGGGGGSKHDRQGSFSTADGESVAVGAVAGGEVGRPELASLESPAFPLPRALPLKSPTHTNTRAHIYMFHLETGKITRAGAAGPLPPVQPFLPPFSRMTKLRPGSGLSRARDFPGPPAPSPAPLARHARAGWDSQGTPPSGQPPRAAPPSLPARDPDRGRRCALAGEPATEGGGGEGATAAGRGVGESSRAVYGLSEAADL